MRTDKELDDLLDSYSVSSAGPGLKYRIAQQARKNSPWAELLAVLGGWRFAGPALAFSMMCGIGAQLWLEQDSVYSNTGADETVWSLAMLDTTQDWNYE